VIDVPPFERITFFRLIGFVNIRPTPPVLWTACNRWAASIISTSAGTVTTIFEYSIYTAAVTVSRGSGVSHLHLLTLTAKMSILEISKSSSAFGFFGNFFVGFRFFFGFFNTDVGVGFGFLKYRDIGSGYRLGCNNRKNSGTFIEVC